MLRTAFLVSALLLTSSSFAQDLAYIIAHDRELQSNISIWSPIEKDDSQSAAATDAAPWLQSVEAVAEELGYYSMRTAADQYSTLDANLLRAYGTADLHAFGGQNDSLQGMGDADAIYRVRFAVASPVQYSLSGYLAAYAELIDWPCCTWDMESAISVHLDQVAGPEVFSEQVGVYATASDPNAPVIQTETASLGAAGTLAPGVYELAVSASANLLYAELLVEPERGVVAETSYIVELEFTPVDLNPDCEAADLDGDGDVDMADYLRLQQCFTGAW